MNKEVELMQITALKLNFRDILINEYKRVSLSLNSQIFRGFDFLNKELVQ